MTEATALGLMTAKGEATERCQCPTCSQVFSTDRNFRRHLTRNRNAEGFDGSWCHPPDDVGLVYEPPRCGISLPGLEDGSEPVFRPRGDGRTVGKPTSPPRGQKRRKSA